MRKILSFVLVFAMLIVNCMVAFALNDDTRIIAMQNIRGIARCSDTLTPVLSENEFNFTLDKLFLSINGDSASIQTTVNNSFISFQPNLYESRLTINYGNQIFGVDTNVVSGYQLVRFTIEKNANVVNLITPNSHFAGNTVVTVVFQHLSTNTDYFFQFVANEIDFPTLSNKHLSNKSSSHSEKSGNADIDKADELLYYELANISSQRVENVIHSLKSIEDTSFGGQGSASVYDGMYSASLFDSKPISPSRGVIDHVDDDVFKSGPAGWSYNNTGYVSTGTNEVTDYAYAIHKTLDSYTGNITSFIATYQVVANFNWSSQQFSQGFIVTNNRWFVYLPTTFVLHEFVYPQVYCMRVMADAHTTISANNQAGHFSTYSTSSTSRTSIQSYIFSILLGVVPGLDVVTAVFQSGTTQTGAIFTCPNYTKSLDARAKELLNPGDQVTVVGTGTDITNFNYSYNYSTTLLNY